MIVGHSSGYEHCVRHFACFDCFSCHHPGHLCFWSEYFRETPGTGESFLVKPIHGKVSRQSMWGITVRIIRAVTPMHPTPAIVVTPLGAEQPNPLGAEKHICYASCVAPAQDAACELELVESAPEALAPDVPPTRRDGSIWEQSVHWLTPYWAARLKKRLGKKATSTPSIGSQVWLRLRVGFRRSMISFPSLRTHRNCIGCALPIIGLLIVSGNKATETTRRRRRANMDA